MLTFAYAAATGLLWLLAVSFLIFGVLMATIVFYVVNDLRLMVNERKARRELHKRRMSMRDVI